MKYENAVKNHGSRFIAAAVIRSSYYFDRKYEDQRGRDGMY